MELPDDIWYIVKSFLFHNIKQHGKHLKDDNNIKIYNNSIKKFNTSLYESNSVRIVLFEKRDQNKNYFFYRFCYHLIINNINKTIIETGMFNKDVLNYENKEEISDKIREEYYNKIKGRTQNQLI